MQLFFDSLDDTAKYENTNARKAKLSILVLVFFDAVPVTLMRWILYRFYANKIITPQIKWQRINLVVLGSSRITIPDTCNGFLEQHNIYLFRFNLDTPILNEYNT